MSDLGCREKIIVRKGTAKQFKWRGYSYTSCMRNGKLKVIRVYTPRQKEILNVIPLCFFVTFFLMFIRERAFRITKVICWMLKEMM